MSKITKWSSVCLFPEELSSSIHLLVLQRKYFNATCSTTLTFFSGTRSLFLPFIQVVCVCEVYRSLNCQYQEPRNSLSLLILMEVPVNIGSFNVPLNHHPWPCDLHQYPKYRYTNLQIDNFSNQAFNVATSWTEIKMTSQ